MADVVRMRGEKMESGYTGTLPVLLGQCGFQAKALVPSGSTDEEEVASMKGKFLGLGFDVERDELVMQTAPFIRMTRKRTKQRRANNETITEEWLESLRTGTHCLTKRRVLAFLMSQYDPLGYRAPLLLKAKLMLKKLYGEGYLGGWDDPLPASFEQEWDIYITMMLQGR